MDYLLTVLTNGRRECFERTMHAFLSHVKPRPTEIFVMDDGGQTGEDFAYDHSAGQTAVPWFYESTVDPVGMCAAHERCWTRAAESDHDWAFHIEDDFVLLRPLDLDVLRKTIELEEPNLTQLALVRTPWGFEIPYGGYIPMFPGYYARRTTFNGVHRYEWIGTQRNWATCPALYRTQLARDYPWSPVPGCETEIGPRLLADNPDALFGLWGWGEPWCSHIGVERQPGAHGY